MTYKEFKDWCNERACDGCWGLLTAMICVEIVHDMDHTPFWKRRKKWRELEKKVITEIVEPTNSRCARSHPLDAAPQPPEEE